MILQEKDLKGREMKLSQELGSLWQRREFYQISHMSYRDCTIFS